MLGSSSMGALRAAELDVFGMVGIGKIYESFRSGVLEDDDEVAIVHAPAEHEYRPLSEALVNIRATLAAAIAAGVIDPAMERALCGAAKETYYPERTYGNLFASASTCLGPDRLAPLRDWVPENRVDQKRVDAIELLGMLGRGARLPGAGKPSFRLEPTAQWVELQAHGRGDHPGRRGTAGHRPGRLARRMLQGSSGGSRRCAGPGALPPTRARRSEAPRLLPDR